MIQQLKENLTLFEGDIELRPEQKIIHFLEFGLGDSVNSICIIKGTKKAFPENQIIVYCDYRWKEIIQPYLSSNDQIITYDSFDLHYESIFEQIGSIEDGVVVPYMVRFPDQWAKGETKQESLVRYLGLRDFVPEVRPEFPVENVPDDSLSKILKENNLEKSKFIVVAPNANRNSIKFWDRDSFESLIRLVLCETNMRVVVMGKQGETDLSVPDVVRFEELPIALAGAIISQSACFVGLDSGLSHVASSFHIPVVVLYPYLDQDVMPFEVRVHTPFASLFCANPKNPRISPEMVFDFLCKLLRNKDIAQTFCPACGRGMWYVEHISKNKVFRKCVCGTRRLVTAISEDEMASGSNNRIAKARVTYEMPNNLLKTESFCEQIESLGKKEISVKIFTSEDKYFSEKQPNDILAENIFWSFDGILFFFRDMGLIPTRIGFAEDSLIRIRFADPKNINFFGVRTSRFVLPWGEKFISLKDIDFYFRYLSWGCWGNRKFLERLPKKIYEFGDVSVARTMAWKAFLYGRSLYSFKYILKYSMIALRHIFRFGVEK